MISPTCISILYPLIFTIESHLPQISNNPDDSRYPQSPVLYSRGPAASGTSAGRSTNLDAFNSGLFR